VDCLPPEDGDDDDGEGDGDAGRRAGAGCSGGGTAAAGVASLPLLGLPGRRVRRRAWSQKQPHRLPGEPRRSMIRTLISRGARAPAEPGG
jgi:hypothetical protein